MSNDSNNGDQTQPIKVNAAVNPLEDTSRIVIVQQKPVSAEEIPGWLLELASQPTQEAVVERQHGLEAIEEPASEPFEAVAHIVLETAEWQVVQAEHENHTSESDEEVPAVAVEQGLQDLLDLGDYDNAADQIRKSATTKELAEEYQRTLRSHLVLQGDRLPLWNIYDELSEMIAQQGNRMDGG